MSAGRPNIDKTLQARFPEGQPLAELYFQRRYDPQGKLYEGYISVKEYPRSKLPSDFTDTLHDLTCTEPTKQSPARVWNGKLRGDEVEARFKKLLSDAEAAGVIAAPDLPHLYKQFELDERARNVA